jgi:hypothetical protein
LTTEIPDWQFDHRRTALSETTLKSRVRSVRSIPGVVKATKVASQEDLRWRCRIFAVGPSFNSFNQSHTETSDPAWFFYIQKANWKMDENGPLK